MKTFALTIFIAILATACSVSFNSSSNASPTPAANTAKPATAGEAPKPSASSTVETKKPEPTRSAETAKKEGGVENRCGWFANPTPGNAWLNDKDGEWIIGTQGGEQAEGDWPDFPDDKWVKTNGNYGYGCACMKVVVDADEMRIVKIVSATAKPIADCKKDKALSSPE